MKRIAYFIVVMTAVGLHYLSAQNLQWTRLIENTGDLDIRLCATNKLGELILYGEATDSINIGGLANPEWKFLPSFTGSTFLVAYDSLGGVKWFQWMGFEESTNIRVTSIVLDDSSSVYISGSSVGTFDIDPGPGIDTISSTKHDRFVAKFSSSGVLIWKYQTYTMPTEPNTIGASTEIIVSPSREVYLLTSIYNEMDLDPSLDTVNVQSSSGMRTFIVIKIGSMGDYQGHALFDGTSSFEIVAPTAFCLNTAGTSIFLGGEFDGTADLDPGPSSQTVSMVGGNADMFFLKLSTSSLSYQWHQVLSGNGSGHVKSIHVDENENLYLSGSNFNEIDFNPGMSVDTIQATGSTGFIARYDPNGGFLGAKKCEESEPKIFVDDNSLIWMADDFWGTVDIEPGQSIVSVTSSGGMDLVVHRHDSTSNLVWNGQITGSSDELLEAHAVSKSGVFYGVGTTKSIDIDVDPSGGVFSFPINADQDNWFIFKLAPWSSQTGNSEEDDLSSWHVFPNPAEDNWNLVGEKAISGNYVLFDATGRVLKALHFKGASEIEIEGVALNAGVYFLKILDDKGLSNTYKLLRK